MKKNVLLLSIIAVLSLTGCGKTAAPSEEEKSEVPSSQVDNTSEAKPSSAQQSKPSSQVSSQASSSKAPSSVEPPDVIPGANFTFSIPKNLSMMSWNCKMYVDDMRAQQQRLIQEKGANADYYLNDLYGTSGVDITKGITEGDSGGYRPANIDNDYLDDVTAKWEDGPFYVMYTHQRLPCGIRYGLCFSYSYQKCSYQTRSVCYAYGIHILKRHSRFHQCSLYHLIYLFDMLS